MELILFSFIFSRLIQVVHHYTKQLTAVTLNNLISCSELVLTETQKMPNMVTHHSMKPHGEVTANVLKHYVSYRKHRRTPNRLNLNNLRMQYKILMEPCIVPSWELETPAAFHHYTWLLKMDITKVVVKYC